MDKPLHIYPLNDLREHVTDGCKCWCNPSIDDEGMIIHNAMDMREHYETGKIKKH